MASLSCWLPDGGSGGVILELAAMVAASQFGWWLPDHTGDKAPLCLGSAMWLGGSFLVYSPVEPVSPTFPMICRPFASLQVPLSFSYPEWLLFSATSL